MRSDEIQRLTHVAQAAMARAYAPYSRFPVGAALLTASGDIYAGCNVENAAYPVGLCAEAGAIAAMVASVGAARIRAILVLVASSERAWPCGACRQRLQEFSQADTIIYAAASGLPAIARPFCELLPLSFGPQNLSGVFTP